VKAAAPQPLQSLVIPPARMRFKASKFGIGVEQRPGPGCLFAMPKDASNRFAMHQPTLARGDGINARQATR